MNLSSNLAVGGGINAILGGITGRSGDSNFSDFKKNLNSQ